VKSSPRSYPPLTRTSWVHNDELCWISVLNNGGHGPVHAYTDPRRALLPAPAAFELARGAPTRETAAGSTLRGVLLEFLAPPRLLLLAPRCAGRFVRTGHHRRNEYRRYQTCRANDGAFLAAAPCFPTAQWRAPRMAPRLSRVWSFNFSDGIHTKRKWPSGGPKAS
jgi:hypothetical protein